MFEISTDVTGALDDIFFFAINFAFFAIKDLFFLISITPQEAMLYLWKVYQLLTR